MITKEIAAKIHHCYTQIEQGELMIEQLKKSINDQGEYTLSKDWAGNSRGLELHIPLGGPGDGASIKRVPLKVGLDTIKTHIQDNKDELKELKVLCKTQLA